MQLLVRACSSSLQPDAAMGIHDIHGHPWTPRDSEVTKDFFHWRGIQVEEALIAKADEWFPLWSAAIADSMSWSFFLRATSSKWGWVSLTRVVSQFNWGVRSSHDWENSRPWQVVETSRKKGCQRFQLLRRGSQRRFCSIDVPTFPLVETSSVGHFCLSQMVPN